jgi:hypothetical protein
VRLARQVRRSTRESRQARARRLRLARQQRFAAHLIAAIRGLTDVARSGAEICAALSGRASFEDLDAQLRAGLDDAQRTLDLARDEAHMVLHS